MNKLQNILENTDGTKGMIAECINIVKKSESIIIFGAGVGGAELYKLLKKNNLSHKIIGWSDNNSMKFNKKYMEERLTIIAPEKLTKQVGVNTTIIIASSAYDKIMQQLLSYGYKQEQIYLYNFAFMDLDYTDKEFVWDHIEDFQRAYCKMSDLKSRNIFTNILNYKITKDDKFLYYLNSYVDDEKLQYFPKELILPIEGEILLDVGAYIGDTLECFDNIYEKKWEHYYGLEADKIVYEKLLKFVENSGFKEKVTIFNSAAWDEETTLFFSENAGSSKMGGQQDKENMLEVKANRIDKILKNKKISYVKMDIEGAEYNALMGMKEIIKKYKPILAVCVYHLRDDFYRLTDLIEEILPNEYIYYMRQYRFTPTETVCYAIPKYRKNNIDDIEVDKS